MGFSKKSAITAIDVRLVYSTVNQTTKEIEDVTVTHKLRVPTIEERNTYQKKVIQFKKNKVSADQSEAAWYLWNKCIIRVEGYDDLPTEGDFKLYFKEDPARQHVDEVIPRFIEAYSGTEDTEAEKKSV